MSKKNQVHQLLSFQGSHKFLIRATRGPLSPAASEHRRSSSKMNELRKEVISTIPCLCHSYDLLLEQCNNNENTAIEKISAGCVSQTLNLNLNYLQPSASVPCPRPLRRTCGARAHGTCRLRFRPSRPRPCRRSRPARSGRTATPGRRLITVAC